MPQDLPPKALSELERLVMRILWAHSPATADDVRRSLEPERTLKDSTVRTVLRRLEAKGFVTHEVEGRTYLYGPRVRPQAAAADAVRKVVDRLLGGSVEDLMVGLVDQRVVDRQHLERLLQLIEDAEFRKGDTDV